MLSVSELNKLRKFVSAQRAGETSPLHRLWAGRCDRLLQELMQLERQVQEATREIDSAAESRSSDTCIM